MRSLLRPLFVLFALSPFSRADDQAEARHLFILSGQSNMREPLIGTFSETVRKALGEDKVVISSFSQPSQPIRRWYRNWRPPESVKAPEGGNGEVYDSLLRGVRKAVNGRPLKSATFIWMQGEEDARLGYASRYEESFYGVLDQLKTDLALPEVSFVLGRINDYWQPGRGIVDGLAMRSLQERIGSSGKNGAWINTDDLNTGVNPWGGYEINGGHFPNPGYRVMGRRFAREACRLAAPGARLDEALFAEAFLAEARQVGSHLALGKPVTGTAPDASHPGSPAGLAALVDGRLGTEDPKDPAWLAFPPTEKSIIITMDLGQPTEISSVAVNLLVNGAAQAHFPTVISVSISKNGTDYSPLLTGRSDRVSFDKHARQLNLAKDFKPGPQLILIEKQAPSVRFVKLEIIPDAAAKAWVYLDEIMVNPVMR